MSTPLIDVSPVDPSTGAMPALVENRVVSLARSANFISVMSYGAKGDGITDDTAALTAAIQAAGPGGQIFLPLGKYRITSPIKLLADQKLTGTSMSSGLHYAEIGSTVTAGASVILGGSSLIESVRVVNYSPSIATGTIGISGPIGTSAATLRDVHVDGFDQGINLTQLWYSLLDHIHVQHCNWGVVLDYSYNVTMLTPRIYAVTNDGVARGGVWFKGKAMGTIHGGAIEGYQTGVQLDAGGHVRIDGTYWETKTGQSANGILFNGKQANAILTGCQVYLTNQRWVNIPAATGNLLVAHGNKFKGGTDKSAWEMAYYWDMPNSGALRMSLGPDSYIDTIRTIPYRPVGTALPVGSTCIDPYGAATGGADQLDGTLYLSGSLMVSGGLLTVPSGTAFPSMAAYTARVGTVFFRTDLKKVGYWDGTTWRDAMGTAITS